MYDLNKIKSEINLLPSFDEQICLQGTKTNKDPFAGTGRVLNLPEKEIEFTYPIFDIPYINSIIEEYHLYRVRLMVLKPKRCYTYHYDLTKRFHIPIKTNDKCFFIVDKEVVQFPADGNYYILDTTKNHTALNGSMEDRLHLIGNLK
tara:strand:+ start:465 stop:905 length:441 start_codon:yes stop_codon:yes gene_type:complete